MSAFSLVREIAAAGGRVWLNTDSVGSRRTSRSRNAMVERLRRDKPEVVEVVRLLPACECGATLLEPVGAWWGGRLVRVDCGAAPGRASGTRRRRRRQRWQHEHDRAIVTSEATAAPNPCDVCDAAAGCLAAINGMPAAPAEH